MCLFVKENSIYSYSGISFDPVADGEILIVTQRWIAYYSRKKTYKYGFKERNINITISNKIKAFEQKNKDDKYKYIEENWISFLNYARNHKYPEYLRMDYGKEVFLEPKYKNIEEIKSEFGELIEQLTPISPYS